MSKGLAQFQGELRRIRPFINTINWSDPTLTPEKAYVAAVFSKAAYLVIPEFEDRYHALAKIIPCLAYWELIATNARPDLGQLILEAEISGDVFVDTDSKYVVAVMIRSPSVIIVSLRGTRPLYITDWMIDFRASKTSVSVGSVTQEVRLHTGFFLAITDCMARISAAIQTRTPDFSIPVCIVGHSLGGAMAAVAFALDGVTFFSRFRYGTDTTVKLGARSSYSYGMPRYGDASATRQLRSPTHVYNSRDVVPVVPPRWIGFANVSDEYRADAPERLLPRAEDHDSPRIRGVRHHLMERYILHLARLAGLPDP